MRMCSPGPVTLWASRSSMLLRTDVVENHVVQ